MPNTSISFPASPTAGQTYTYGSTTYTFDGSYWSVNGSSVDQVSTNDIQNGAVTPAKLSTGGPSWASGGDLTITGDLTVDTNTLFVDASANRVGVKTNSPIANYGLTVLDNIYVGNGSNLSPSGTGLGHISINGDGYTGYLTLDSTDMHIGHNASSRGITFDTNETTRITIPSDSSGIKFPSSPVLSSNVNTLDAYEEGTWTPVFTGLTLTAGTLSGRYTRIGRVVILEMQLLNATFTGTGDGTISGCPSSLIPANRTSTALMWNNTFSSLTTNNTVYWFYGIDGYMGFFVNSISGQGWNTILPTSGSSKYLQGTLVYTI